MKKIKENKSIIFFEKEEIKEEIKEVLKGNYNVKMIYQNKKNCIVLHIEVKDKTYILKKEKGRGIIDKILGSKARITLKNATLLKEKGYKNIAGIKGVIEVYETPLKSKTYLLMEYIEGDIPRKENEYEKVFVALKELHKHRRYHGDLKPKNVILKNNYVYFIDSKYRKEITGLGKWKDIIRFQKKTGKQIINKYFREYKKTLSYYIAIELIYRKDAIKRCFKLIKV